MSSSDHETAHVHHELGFLRKYVFSEDHKIIGIQFLCSTLIFLIIGGLLPMFLLMQQDHSETRMLVQMPDEFHNLLAVMVLFVCVPNLMGALGNFTIPLMAGVRDMALPRLNMLSYWLMWPAFVLALMSFLVGSREPAAAGWVSYPTLASVAQGDISSTAPSPAQEQTLWVGALALLGASLALGLANHMTTLINGLGTRNADVVGSE